MIESDLKRVQSLRAALLIDLQREEEATELLTHLCDEEYAKFGDKENEVKNVREDESDTEILVLSLLGILKRQKPGQEDEGRKLLE